MGSSSFAVLPITAGDWRAFKALRIEMLLDTPLAYGERADTAQAADDDEWRERAARNEQPGNCGFAAVTPDGAWIGCARSFTTQEAPRRPMVVGVYVAPAWRGSAHGVLDALLAAVEETVRARADALVLHVHERNDRAIAAYSKRGFILNGAMAPYELDPTQVELEMERTL